MIKHTPGTWHRSAGTEIISDDDRSITLVNNRRYEWEANANLIASAPDLLAACEALLKADEGTNDMWAMENALRNEVIPLARAAVEKAKGDQIV